MAKTIEEMERELKAAKEAEALEKAEAKFEANQKEGNNNIDIEVEALEIDVEINDTTDVKLPYQVKDKSGKIVLDIMLNTDVKSLIEFTMFGSRLRDNNEDLFSFSGDNQKDLDKMIKIFDMITPNAADLVYFLSLVPHEIKVAIIEDISKKLNAAADRL